MRGFVDSIGNELKGAYPDADDDTTDAVAIAVHLTNPATSLPHEFCIARLPKAVKARLNSAAVSEIRRASSRGASPEKTAT